MIIVLLSKGVQLAEIKNKFSEFNPLYIYITQKREILISERKILIILQKLRNK